MELRHNTTEIRSQTLPDENCNAEIYTSIERPQHSSTMHDTQEDYRLRALDKCGLNRKNSALNGESMHAGTYFCLSENETMDRIDRNEDASKKAANIAKYTLGAVLVVGLIAGTNKAINAKQR